jgi:DNA topoisomerase IB
MRGLVKALYEELVSDHIGRWVTIGGRPVFIANDTPDEMDLNAIKPPDRAPDDDVTTVLQKDGTERKEYSKRWLQLTGRYKFAKVVDIERRREEIENNLSNDVEEALASGEVDRGAQASLCSLLVSKTGMRPGSPGQGTKVKSGDSKGVLQRTYGATTIQKRHVSVSGDTVRFQYLGKSGVQRDVSVTDPVVARGVSRLLDGKGDEEDLFDGINEDTLIRRVKRFNKHYKSKDFRTAIAMQEATDAIAEILSGERQKIPDNPEKVRALARKLVAQVGKRVAARLGNTPAVAISNYVSPTLIEHFLSQYGIPRNLLESAMEHLKTELMRAAGAPLDLERLPMLTILYGKEAMAEWAARWTNDREDAEDVESEHWKELPE